MKKSSGGAAAAGGMDFQHRVAALMAVHILAEKAAAPLWDLPAGTTLEWFRCETGQPVDDLVVGTSANGLVFIQTKRTLRLSRTTESYLASALDQFVRQFVACRGKTTGPQPWDRPLDPARDRLVLVTSPSSSSPVRVHLSEVCRRQRLLVSGQLLDTSVISNEEHRVLSVVRMYVARSWQRTLGADLSENEFGQLLSLIRVHVVDVEDGGIVEREARTLLRTGVLQDPDAADMAWTQLVSFCAGLAAKRSGADRLVLQRALLGTGVEIKAPQSYHHDIERLRNYSATTFKTLAHLAEIRVGSAVIKVKRPSTAALEHAAETNSVLVVGEPGAGKSGALHDLVERFEEHGLDYVFLAVDHVAAYSLGELREEIGLDHELPEVLDNWPGTQAAFLVIDALDAARGDPAGMMIRDLISQVVQGSGRWRVVASIRKFDLRYGVEIKELFSGVPPTEFQDGEFKGTQHVNIPRLSDDELNEIAAQSAQLAALVSNALVELRDILRVPFNVRLMAELLGAGVAADELTPIRTQLELLHRYWSHRVIRTDGHGDAREGVLRNTCEKMVALRTLRIDRSAIAESGGKTYLKDLLSTQLLVEWQSSPEALPERYILAFAHNVLFDYAVAVLLLRGIPDGTVDRLASSPELAVIVRPSILLHFRYLWAVDNKRHQFWDLVFRVIQESKIPEVGKLIGPSVAAELAKELSDLEPLYVSLQDSTPDNSTAAEKALQHLFGALLAGAPGEVALKGPSAGPWCQFLERVSRTLRPTVAYTVRSLLTTICERHEDFTQDQRIAAGHTARRLLVFAWAQTLRDHWLVIHAIQTVCRTFESDVAASAALLRRCLEPIHLSQHGFEEMPWLAREVKRMIDLDPALIGEIYRTTFTYEETSRESTQMGSGRILSMTSNRQQDYQMARFELGNAFPAFLEHAPETATSTLIAVTEAYIAERHHTASGVKQEETFDFDGRQARLRHDYSAVWDEDDLYRHDDAFKMLGAFQQYLETLADQPAGIDKLKRLVELLVSENRTAVLWRKVLRAAAHYPVTLGRVILPFAWTIPVLRSYDTTFPAGEFLKAISPIISHGERERIEQAILTIPQVAPQSGREAGEYVRNRLLGCLPEFVTNEGKSVIEQLRATNAVPSNEPPKHFTVSRGPYGEEEYLKDQGVPIDAEANRRIREFERPVKEFADKHLNSTPSPEEISTALTFLRTLYNALSRAEADGVHQELRDYAWGSLTAACARAAITDGLFYDALPGSFVKAVLLEASRHAVPVPDPASDAQFDEHISWGTAPRIEAARGIAMLACHTSGATPDVLEPLEWLSKDPVPAVRYEVARRVNVLYLTAPDLMWRIIERMCREEVSRGALQGLLNGPLMRLAGAEPDRISALTKTIFGRVTEGPGAKTVREFCIGIFSGLYIWHNQAQCRDIILEIATHPASYPLEAPHLLAHLREPLTHGPVHPPDPVQDAIRRRAMDLLERILRSTRSALHEMELRHPEIRFSDWPPDEKDSAQSLGSLIEHAGSEVYFASGAYIKRGQGQPGEDQPLMRGRAKRFYDEARPILDELADAGLASVTHHLLETLEFFIPVDPRGVFLYIGRAIHAGQQGLYQYESLGADLVVRLVEQYLAEYRTLLRDNTECRQMLIAILDAFVQPGWPTARRLAYRLEEIFR